jgi:hypothetical protein
MKMAKNTKFIFERLVNSKGDVANAMEHQVE